MRIPLFQIIRRAKEKSVPPEIKHSGILSYHWLMENKMGLWFLAYELPRGIETIEEIAKRIHKKEIINRTTYEKTCKKIAKTIYGPAPYRNYVSNYCSTRCGEGFGNVFAFGEWSSGMIWNDEFIQIKEAKTVPCRWCGSRVIVTDKMEKKGLYKHYGAHCNSYDCRRMSHFWKIPQSKGGIALTPKQRQTTLYEAWDSQIAINYFLQVTKEVKRKCKSNKS